MNSALDKARTKRWASTHKVETAKYQIEYYARNKAKLDEYHRNYYLKHKTHLNELGLKNYYANHKQRRQKLKDYYYANREEILKFRREHSNHRANYIKNRLKILKLSRLYRDTPEFRAYNAEKKRREYAVPEIRFKMIARGKARRAISLVGRSCEECGSINKLNRHHYLGYDKPLDVEILCESCHLQEHGKIPMEMVVK